MLTLRIGIQTACLRLPLRKALQTAAELGAEAVEIDARNELKPSELTQTGLRQFRKLLDDLNLKVCAVGFRTRRGFDAEEDLDRRVAATKQAMQMAHGLGATVVINQIGPVPAGTGEDLDAADQRRWQLLTAVLTDLAHFGQHAGALLAAETGTESGEDLARVLASCPEGLVTVNLDPANLIVNGFSPAEAIAALGPNIAHVHINDAVPDRSRGRGIEVPIGRGMADFPSLLALLEEHDYRGYFTIQRSESDEAVFEVGQAMKFLRNLD
jgi:sugar phosphate isomerase/epimerase